MSPVPADMAAIVTSGKGGPEVMRLETIATPMPGPGQVLIQVAAAGVNRPDVLQRKGLYPAPKGHSEILGLEVAGHVASLGEGATGFTIGDRVMALVNGGGYARYAVADTGATLAVPPSLSMVEAAGIPETAFTVWHNVFERGALQPGEWLLVHGGSSGIGTTAIQLAKAFGANVIATAGSGDKCAACRALGADHAVDYRNEDFVDAVKSATGGRGADVILDMVGGDYIERNIKCAAEDARIVNIGYQSGSVATIDFMRVMLKRLTLTGSTLRVRSSDVKAGIAQAVGARVIPLAATGAFKVIVDRTYPLAEAAAAHARMESSQHIGKIVLTVA
ncbi:MAG: NAD(P)H-quinone oxidoreductase [Hyphomicrobium sp.]